MTYFLKNGNTYQVSSKEAMDLHETLPAGNYVVKQAPMDGPLYLESIDAFEFKGKRYGDNTRNTDRIIRTFQDRPATTGVMLTGEKGSGKSLLAKSVAMKAVELGMPTIIVNQPWCGDKFNTFIQSIEQPCVLLFDEFEKVYDREDQESILTLLDGVFPTKKLFMLTCNDKYRVDQHMRNRPGRIYYMIDFKGLDVDFIVEYCNDNLEHKQHIDAICKISSLFNEFNFDMLKAMVEEINRYGETPQEVMRLLNAKPEFEEKVRYTVDLFSKGAAVPKEQLEYSEWHGNPLQRPLSFEYDPAPDDSDSPWVVCSFAQSDLKELDPQAGRFTFCNAAGDKLTLTRVRDKAFDYFMAF